MVTKSKLDAYINLATRVTEPGADSWVDMGETEALAEAVLTMADHIKKLEKRLYVGTDALKRDYNK